MKRLGGLLGFLCLIMSVVINITHPPGLNDEVLVSVLFILTGAICFAIAEK